MKRIKNLTGKTIVITGSTKGIGKSAAEACAESGANVVLNSRRVEDVDQACRTLKDKGLFISGCPADISRVGDLDDLFRHAIDTWGGIDVWINNAGLSGGYRYIQDLSQDEICAIINVNLKGTLLASQMLIRYFRKKEGGILINVSGRGGKSEPAPYLTTYATTKAAVSSLTRSLAQENRDIPISIHSVIPGMVDTGFYIDVPTSDGLKGEMRNIRYVLHAFGTPTDLVGRRIAQIAAQIPGRQTGRQYTLLGPVRMARGIILMSWHGMRGKLKKSALSD